ncbi:MAG TPA: hypothetical protein VGH58_00910 [Solirubrobacterales bacterium]
MFSTLRIRLRHPISSGREPFGKAGLTVAVCALVFAMLGGAYAANSSGGGKATASAKAKRGPRGPKGATGPAGPQGLPGASGKDGAEGKQGPEGKAGPTGPTGATGTAGDVGEPGKGVISNEILAEPGETTCSEQGGAEYEVEDSGQPTTICNGKEGSPWTAGGTLPPGAVETGLYFAEGKEGEEAIAQLSFPISLAAEIGEDENNPHVFYGKGTNAETGTQFTQHCPGPNFLSPAVLRAGDLCVYERILSNAELLSLPSKAPGGFSEFGAATKQGAYLTVVITGKTGGLASGSFAVKGCSLTTEPNKCP